jgi:ribonuclease HI
LLITLDGEELSSSLRLEFRTTNNEAEYKAIIVGLGMALELGARSVKIQSDSQVIMGHIRGEFEAKGERIKRYLSKVHDM